MIDGTTQRVGLIGWPVEHSLSPAMHNAAFAELDLDWHYGLLPTPDDTIASRLEEVRTQYRGANVTVPHKERVMAHLDHIDETAKIIGAVNTILVRNGRLEGYNTDAAGFLAGLTQADFRPAGRHALVLGAGGAARAVVAALKGADCTVTLHNRRPQRAIDLAERAGGGVRGLPAGTGLEDLDVSHFDLLVNTTPVGMWPDVEACPWPEALSIPSWWTIYDLVYNPSQTRLLDRAAENGAKAIGGLEMLIQQGAMAFALWTGRQPPLDVMQAAAKGALEQPPY
jgi:shikimate dehydrogenase